MDTQGKRHFGVWQGRDRVVLLGYSKRNNDVLAVRLDLLPEDERNELVQIATNESMQTKYELTPTLANARHSKSGETWMTNVAMRLRRGDGSVIRAYVKNLSDVHPDQLAYYKGYGPKDAPGGLKISEAEKAAVLGDDYRQRELGSTTSASITPPADLPVEVNFGQPAPAAPQSDALASALTQLATNMAGMATTLAEIKTSLKPAKRGPKPKAKPQILVETAK